MDDPSKPNPGFFERLISRLTHEPDERAELLLKLRAAVERNLLDAEAMAMIEGVLSFSQLTVGDVMIPRSQMDVIKLDTTIERFLPFVVEKAHSRFPVVGDTKDEVLGILLAKDLLRHFIHPDTFDLKSCLRPAAFVPETKQLDAMLKDFRATHNHMAIVVNEYGGVTGVVTIEDVIEEIVGEIEDEFDDDEKDNIVPITAQRFRVNALTEIAEFNAFFSTKYPDDEVDTIGGLVISRLGHLPIRGESIEIAKLKFNVVRADSRRLYTLVVTPKHEALK